MSSFSQSLKARLRNHAVRISAHPQDVFQGYLRERFLARLAESAYADHFVLKGGVLVASLIGLDRRATMDLDATLVGETLDEEHLASIMQSIISIDLEDGFTFQLNHIVHIMPDTKYPGLRVIMTATAGNMKDTLSLDISTGDMITPGPVPLAYSMLLEDRELALIAYPVETILAEKLETIFSRGIANTRMRDFYDIHVLWEKYRNSIAPDVLHEALFATSSFRHSQTELANALATFESIKQNDQLVKLWQTYQKRVPYARHYDWSTVLQSVESIGTSAGLL